MVNDIVRAPEVRVLVAEDIEAMRAGRDDGLLGDFVSVECFDVLLGEHLEKVFVTRAASRVAGARLLGA